MPHISPAQRYEKAEAHADRDRNRPKCSPPTLDLGQVTLKELRGIMGLSLQQLSDMLADVADVTWSKAQLSRIEDGARGMTIQFQEAIERLLDLRRKR